ncbi:unnamed protein product, partial [Rotaria sordida]
ASETSEQWANISAHVDEQLIDLSSDIDRLTSIDERFEQSTKFLTHLRDQHEDFLVEFLSLKKIVEKTRIYLREYKRRWSQINDENRHLHIEIKRLRDKIDDFHRAEKLMYGKIDEQDIALNQLRKELNNEIQVHSEAELTIEKLQRTLNETIFKHDQLMKNMTNANKKIEEFEDDIVGYRNENHLLQQTSQKLEKQLTTLHTQNQLLESTLELNEKSHYEKTNEYESLLISLKEANKNSLHLLEQREAELNTVQSDLQTIKYEQSITIAKLQKLEEINQELILHISLLERSIEEHKRLIRKREKELEQVKNEFEHKILNVSSLSNKCTKQDAEMSILRIENASLNEELRLMRENVNHCQEQQRRLRKDCDQALTFIQDEIPDICLSSLNDENNNNNHNGKLQTYVMQYVTDNRENLKIDNTLWFPFVQNITYDHEDFQGNRKKYKLMKAYSKQQQLLLNKLEAHVQFYESIFEKTCLPAIEYSKTTETSNVLDSSHDSKTDKSIHARAHDVDFSGFSPKEIMIRTVEDSKISVPFVSPLAS